MCLETVSHHYCGHRTTSKEVCQAFHIRETQHAQKAKKRNFISKLFGKLTRTPAAAAKCDQRRIEQNKLTMCQDCYQKRDLRRFIERIPRDLDERTRLGMIAVWKAEHRPAPVEAKVVPTRKPLPPLPPPSPAKTRTRQGQREDFRRPSPPVDRNQPHFHHPSRHLQDPYLWNSPRYHNRQEPDLWHQAENSESRPGTSKQPTRSNSERSSHPDRNRSQQQMPTRSSTTKETRQQPPRPPTRSSTTKVTRHPPPPPPTRSSSTQEPRGRPSTQTQPQTQPQKPRRKRLASPSKYLHSEGYQRNSTPPFSQPPQPAKPEPTLPKTHSQPLRRRPNIPSKRSDGTSFGERMSVREARPMRGEIEEEMEAVERMWLGVLKNLAEWYGEKQGGRFEPGLNFAAASGEDPVNSAPPRCYHPRSSEKADYIAKKNPSILYKKLYIRKKE